MFRPGSLYDNLITKRVAALVFMTVFLIIIVSYAVTLGVADISWGQTYRTIISVLLGQVEYAGFVSGIVLRIRLPRILLAVICGFALGANGAVMQSLLKNPLASPYTLGISSGSALGAGIAIVLGTHLFGSSFMAHHGSWVTIIGAFQMGLVTIAIISVIASIKNRGSATLILAGVALSYLFSAGISLLKYVSAHEELAELTVWLMGGLYRAEWTDIVVLVPITVFSLLWLLKLSWDINTLNAGEEVATNLGINVKALRRKGVVITAFLTSSVVAFTGVIGFVGLLAPHLCRMFFGNDNRFLIAASALMGAIILVTADTAARLIISPTELPVGIITSVLGAPFFLYMLIQRKKSYF